MTLNEQIAKLIAEAYTLARNEVERLARKTLREHDTLSSFIMAMGDAFFTTKKGEDLALEDRPYFKPLLDFMQEWDRQLGLTGGPMWIDGPDAPIKTQW